MGKVLFLLTAYFCSFSLSAQTRDTIIIGGDTMIQVTGYSPADSLRLKGDIKGCIKKFQSMMQQEGRKFHNYYNYACALAVDMQVDSAFYFLNLDVKRSADELALIDPDFLNLRKDKRWEALENELIDSLKQKYKKQFKDLYCAKKLWYMHATDQAYYDCIELAVEKLGPHSTIELALWQLKKGLNEQNQKELIRLVDEKGWPKITEVGDNAAQAAFLVIQHADSGLQKKYLPQIEVLCKQGEADWQSYALMYDRIQTSENKPQKYGSQVHYNEEKHAYELLPLLDESKVDEWRREAGLRPLADYLTHWGIKFEPKK